MVSFAIWKNIDSRVLQRLQIVLVLRTRAILIIFEKLTVHVFSKLNSKPHAITYTNCIANISLIMPLWVMKHCEANFGEVFYVFVDNKSDRQIYLLKL